jgi:phosphate transport system substrate-binding protein
MRPPRHGVGPTGLVLLLLALGLLAAQGCASRERPRHTDRLETVRLKGSDTMRILAQRWAEDYMKTHDSVSIYVEGGGTRLGVEALLKGETDIACASRTLNADEVRRLHERHGSLGFRFLCAKDALSIYLHPENPVRDLSSEELAGILSGKIQTWDQVGGEKQRIRVLVREPNSGTRAFIRDHVLSGESYSGDAVIIVGTQAVADSVAADRAAIGFGGLAYGQHVYHCRIDGAPPTAENVRDGSYPIARYLYFYTAREPTGAVKQFIDWVLSASGQTLVEEVGYISLWDLE